RRRAGGCRSLQRVEDRRWCAAGPGAKLLILAVVLLATDESALVVVGVVQAPELATAEIAVGKSAVGGVVQPLFVIFDARDLAPGERAVGDAGVGADVL